MPLSEIRKGGPVRVVRACPDCACGWVGAMDEFVGDGKTYGVSWVGGTDAYVDTNGPGDGWWFPFDALEPVNAIYGNEED